MVHYKFYKGYAFLINNGRSVITEYKNNNIPQNGGYIDGVKYRYYIKNSDGDYIEKLITFDDFMNFIDGKDDNGIILDPIVARNVNLQHHIDKSEQEFKIPNDERLYKIYQEQGKKYPSLMYSKESITDSYLHIVGQIVNGSLVVGVFDYDKEEKRLNYLISEYYPNKLGLTFHYEGEID